MFRGVVLADERVEEDTADREGVLIDGEVGTLFLDIGKEVNRQGGRDSASNVVKRKPGSSDGKASNPA